MEKPNEDRQYKRWMLALCLIVLLLMLAFFYDLHTSTGKRADGVVSATQSGPLFNVVSRSGGGPKLPFHGSNMEIAPGTLKDILKKPGLK